MPKSVDEKVVEQITTADIAHKNTSQQEQPTEGRKCTIVTVSRELASGGGDTARLVAKHLNWSFWDRELVEAIAEDANVHTRVVEYFDERTVSELYSLAHSLAGNYDIGNFMYRHHLARALLPIAKIGYAVILGRGANLILKDCLNVRIYASMDYRIRSLVEREFTADQAKNIIEHSDKERARFIRKNFDQDINDIHTYDLMIKMDETGIEGAAELIVSAVAARTR